MSFRASFISFVCTAVSLWAPIAVSDVPKVVASIAPVHSLVAAVMGSLGTPHLLLSANQSPHHYSLKPSDMRKLADAEVVFWVGESLEGFLAKPLASVADRAVQVELISVPGVYRVEAGSRPQDLESINAESLKRWSRPKIGAAFGVDPHLWLDPDNAVVWVRAIAVRLAYIDPSHGTQYRDNAERYVNRIEALSVQIENQMRPLTNRPFAVFHDGYRYFENRYGVHSVAAITAVTEVQPSAERIRRVSSRLSESGAVCVFTEPQFPPRLVKTVTQGLDIKIQSLDPLGSDQTPGVDLYLRLMQQLAASFETCLSP